MIQLLIMLNVFFVTFTDKPTNTAPALSDRALEQRSKWDIVLDDLDYPVSAAYLDSLREYGASIHHTSRWMNGATCTMTDEQAEQVAGLPFVAAVEKTRDNSPRGAFYKRRSLSSAKFDHPTGEMENTAVTDEQLALFNLKPLHDLGFHGQGILMVICDGGFYNVNTLSCFRHEQELGHFDFTDDTDDFYGYTGTHGTYCLSAISGKLNNYFGAATETEYYLMRSEEADTESPKEMDNLVAALEAADSLGANVFSVSLGYAMFDNDAWTLSYSDLDGRRTRSSYAATIAARKGMLVCAAAGNEGYDSWHWIDSPADADSILTVGAVNVNGRIGGFSSYGPSYDGRVKPEVCAVGVDAALISPSGNVTYSNGTSFATPLLAGMAATLWSALPDESAMQIRERIIRSANRYDNPDTDQYGYGIPDAYAAYTSTTTLTTTPVSSKPTKYIEGNTLYIYHDGKIYTVFGASKP